MVTGGSASLTTIQQKAADNWEGLWYIRPQQQIGDGAPDKGFRPVWSWYDFPVCKQKLVDTTKFDPWLSRGDGFFTKGAHMPLLMFCGNESRRTSPKRKARLERATA